MYRIWIEEVLGFRLRGGRLTIAPVIPDEWPGFEITFRHGSATYEISVKRKGEGELVTLEEDGRRVEGDVLMLVSDGSTHRVIAFLPKAPLPDSRGLLETTLQESK